METLRTLTTDRTHLFPGARLVVDGPTGEGSDEVVVLFSDGTRAEAALVPAPGGFSLRVEDHRTAAGTSLPARSWALRRQDETTLRVARRIDERA